jgi:rhodanese-related sulfurtransferase
LSRKPEILILDVRTSGEFDAGHLRDAKNIPIQKLAARIRELDGRQATPLLVHCTRGVRSAKASKLLDENGFKSIYHFRGGMDAWLAAGYPVIKETRR